MLTFVSSIAFCASVRYPVTYSVLSLRIQIQVLARSCRSAERACVTHYNTVSLVLLQVQQHVIFRFIPNTPNTGKYTVQGNQFKTSLVTGPLTMPGSRESDSEDDDEGQRVLSEDTFPPCICMFSEVPDCSLLRPSLRYRTTSRRIPISDSSRGMV